MRSSKTKLWNSEGLLGTLTFPHRSVHERKQSVSAPRLQAGSWAQYSHRRGRTKHTRASTRAFPEVRFSASRKEGSFPPSTRFVVVPVFLPNGRMFTYIDRLFMFILLRINMCSIMCTICIIMYLIMCFIFFSQFTLCDDF